jgi:hypothetical protein
MSPLVAASMMSMSTPLRGRSEVRTRYAVERSRCLESTGRYRSSAVVVTGAGRFGVAAPTPGKQKSHRAYAVASGVESDA